MAGDRLRAPNDRGFTLIGLSVLLLLVGSGLVGGYALQSPDSDKMASERKPEASDVDPAAVATWTAAADAYLDQEVTVQFGERQQRSTWRALGLIVDDSAIAHRARAEGAIAIDRFTEAEFEGVVPVVANRVNAADALAALKPTVDLMSSDARLVLEERKVEHEKQGYGVDVYSSVTAIEAAARKGESTAVLEGIVLEPAITVADLGIDNISTVLASFETRFAVSEKSRNSNLKLAASKLDGHILQPGEEFSFNAVVGDRTEKEGYKIAHVITAGEMVDGLAGGACQISTTLHGAAFFAGIDIVSSTPHSRPSTYVHMGLDATVVYPYVDLKLLNSYDFPVVIHYRVARGKAVVEILGKERPYDKIMFEREVDEQLDFDTITREDSELPVGSMIVEQDGFYGYKLLRHRKFFRDGKLVKKNKWKLFYRPVTEYVRLGINPDPNLPPPEQGKGHGPKPPKAKLFRLTQ